VSTTTTLRPSEIAVITSGRLASTTAFRIVYPLLPFLSQTFATSLQQVATLVAIQTAASLISPVGGRLAERFGEKNIMIAGLLLFIAGGALCAIADLFFLFQIGYLCIGLGTALYLPSGQSYLSARSEYSQRGRILGIFEIAWAISAIIGVAPLMYLIDMQDSIRMAYLIIIAIGAVNVILLSRLPASPVHATTQSTPLSFRDIVRQPAVWILLCFPFLTFGGNDLFFVTQSQWLADAIRADESMLGTLFVGIGIAELLGSSAVVAFSDHIGKRRSVIIGFVVTSVLLVAMAFTSNWWLLMVEIFLFYLIIEYAIVASFPLISEAMPHARATIMSLMSAAVGVGRIFSSLGSAWLYTTGGMYLIATTAAVCSCLGLVALARSSLTPKS
jgi:MFS transporter, DHA1 family, inner membrane transport protein